MLNVVDDLVGPVPAVQEVLLKVLLRSERLNVGLEEVHLLHGHKGDIVHGPDNIASLVNDVTVRVLSVQRSIGGGIHVPCFSLVRKRKIRHTDPAQSDLIRCRLWHKSLALVVVPLLSIVVEVVLEAGHGQVLVQVSLAGCLRLGVPGQVIHEARECVICISVNFQNIPSREVPLVFDLDVGG